MTTIILLSLFVISAIISAYSLAMAKERGQIIAKLHKDIDNLKIELKDWHILAKPNLGFERHRREAPKTPKKQGISPIPTIPTRQTLKERRKVNPKYKQITDKAKEIMKD